MKTFDPAVDKDRVRDTRAMAEASTGSLFTGRPASAHPAKKAPNAPELAAARVLCRQLARKRVSAEKKRIVHLICLNLLTVLKRRSQEA